MFHKYTWERVAHGEVVANAMRDYVVEGKIDQCKCLAGGMSIII